MNDDTEFILEEDYKPKLTNSILTHPDKEIEGTTMPPHIKKNFIYRKVWREVWEQDSNASFIVVGKPGIGKSVNALKMCYDLDPTFNMERVCYSIDQFLKLLDEGDANGKLHPGNCILFDEIVTDKGADSRSALSKTNKLMNYINATFRAKRLVVFYCLPSLMQLDKNIRDINITGIFEVNLKSIKMKKNRCKFRWSMYDPRTQKAYGVFPRLIDKKGQIKKVTAVWIGLPPKELEKAYQAKKMFYLNENIKRWNEDRKKELTKTDNKRMNDNDLIIKIRKDPDKFKLKGEYNAFKIRQEFLIGVSKATGIAGFLNKSNN